MQAKPIRALLAALALAFCAASSWPQANSMAAEGRVTSGGRAVAGAQVVLINQSSFRTAKARTATNGSFSFTGLPRGSYTVEVFSATGEALYRKDTQISGDSSEPFLLDIVLTGAPVKIEPPPAQPPPPAAETTPPASKPAPPGKSSAPDTSSVDAYITKYNAALSTKDWPAAIAALKAIVAADPSRWDFYDALGNVQMTAEDYDGAAQSFGKGVEAAQQYIEHGPADGSRILQSDRDRAKTGLAQMMVNQGNAYLKQKKNDEAIDAYTKAAALAPDPGTAYFNLCVVHYNTAKVDGAIAACDKAIAASPNRPDAYFIKGALLVAASKTDKNGKVTAPPGTAETLRKYLELAPQGAHAADVRKMLAYIGARVP